jgi:FtsH-binding integral membrane protein
MSTTTAPVGVVSRGRDATLFARTMQYVAGTAALFTVGAYLGRNLHGAVGIIAFFVAFGSLLGLQAAVRRSTAAAVALLATFGVLMGLAVAPTLAYYAAVDPTALWQSAGATAVFVAGFGAAGYATQRDLTVLARISSWALVGLLVFGLVLVFVQIPHGAAIYSIIGLVVFAALIAVDFRRLRRSTDLASAPLLAASIFLDILNVFLFFLQLFAPTRE